MIRIDVEVHFATRGVVPITVTTVLAAAVKAALPADTPSGRGVIQIAGLTPGRATAVARQGYVHTGIPTELLAARAFAVLECVQVRGQGASGRRDEGNDTEPNSSHYRREFQNRPPKLMVAAFRTGSRPKVGCNAVCSADASVPIHGRFR